MKDTMQNLTKLPKSTLLPALGLLFFVFVAVAGVYIAQYQQMNRGPVTPNAPELSQAGGNVCTTSWIAKVPQTATPTPGVTPSPSPSPSPSPTPTPTPTPTPGVECEDCNFQVDAYWGPVINDFGKRYVGQTSGPNARYSTNPNGTLQGKRLIVARSDEQNPQYPGCLNINPTGDNAAVPVLSEECRDPIGRGLITYDLFDVNRQTGVATIKISNNTGGNTGTPPCTYDNVGLVAYKTNWSLGFEEQEIFDLSEGILYPFSSQVFIIDLPMNNDGPQCHVAMNECPANAPLTANSFASPLPTHAPWTSGQTDVITYTDEYPVLYHYVTEIIEQQDVPSTPNIVYSEGTGTLIQGQNLTINYPPQGEWGNADPNGMYEMHTTVNFQQISDGEECGAFGINWDRYYSDQTVNLTVTNPALLGSKQFQVRSADGKTVLKDVNGVQTHSVGYPRGSVTVQYGLPASVKSVQVYAYKGNTRVELFQVGNNQLRTLTSDLAGSGTVTFDPLKSGQTKVYTW